MRRIVLASALGLCLPFAGCVTDPLPLDDGPTKPDSGVEPVPPLRFAVLGDAGEGNEAQYAVGGALASVCASQGCEFVLYLGDNFYDTGVSSIDDPQFETKFELPYAEVDAPFRVVLGNHDYGLWGLGTEWWKAPIEVRYGEVNPKWVMPSEYYAFTEPAALFLALDTNALLHDRTTAAQAELVESELARSTRPWRIAFGHHPYRSNGSHGNANRYDGIIDPFLPIPRGEHFAAFFEEHLCGDVDVYFAGHDHNRQWLDEDCGTVHVVSGAGAKTTGLEFRDDNPYAYADDTEPGFLWIEIDGDTMLARFYDQAGEVDFETTLTRPSLGRR